jgi:hypothetical protein
MDRINITQNDIVSSSTLDELGQIVAHIRLNDNISIYKFRMNLKIYFEGHTWDIIAIYIKDKRIDLVRTVPYELSFINEVE